MHIDRDAKSDRVAHARDGLRSEHSVANDTCCALSTSTVPTTPAREPGRPRPVRARVPACVPVPALLNSSRCPHRPASSAIKASASPAQRPRRVPVVSTSGIACTPRAASSSVLRIRDKGEEEEDTRNRPALLVSAPALSGVGREPRCVHGHPVTPPVRPPPRGLYFVISATRWHSRYAAGLSSDMQRRGTRAVPLSWAAFPSPGRGFIHLASTPSAPAAPETPSSFLSFPSRGFFPFLDARPPHARPRARGPVTGHRRDLSRTAGGEGCGACPFYSLYHFSPSPSLPPISFLGAPSSLSMAPPSPHTPPPSYFVPSLPSLPPSLVTFTPPLPRSSAASRRSDELHAVASSSIMMSERFDDSPMLRRRADEMASSLREMSWRGRLRAPFSTPGASFAAGAFFLLLSPLSRATICPVVDGCRALSFRLSSLTLLRAQPMATRKCKGKTESVPHGHAALMLNGRNRKKCAAR
ncbi:hypothetical protein C8R44DRAFT_987121 [Mycena epipterygia]|nr:hypothetical protein C8R44DRAFT_987121 [Mycena epipterygia]